MCLIKRTPGLNLILIEVVLLYFYTISVYISRRTLPSTTDFEAGFLSGWHTGQHLIQNGTGLFDVHLHEDRMCKHPVDIIRFIFLMFRENVLPEAQLQVNLPLATCSPHSHLTYSVSITEEGKCKL